VSYHRRLREIPDLTLFNESDDYCQHNRGYIPSFLLVTYLTNHFGGERLFKRLLESPLTGWSNILDSIRSLKREGVIQIDESLLSAPKILRHFAVALWINDPFPAKYALFQLDPQFEALSAKSSLSGEVRLQDPSSFMRGESRRSESRIVFTKRGPVPGATETFALRSRNPLVLQPSQPLRESPTPDPKMAEVFISIFHDQDQSSDY
jgi:hypothetical protein